MTVPAFLHPFSPTGATDHVTLVSGSGSTVVDQQGRSYLDAIASLWCVSVGHGRPEVIDAITDQVRCLATYNTFGRWSNEPADRLAEAIAARAPIADARVFFTNSGSEAVDTALKLARLTHVLGGQGRRSLIVARDGGYHGTAYGGTSAQGMPANRADFGPFVDDVIHVGRHDLDGLAAALEARPDEQAAVIVEPLQGASGVHTPVDGYLKGVRDLCDASGALLIFDEVITGFGRLGTWFAAERYDVEPDLITFAKAVTSGYIPMGGVIVGRRTREAIEADPDYVLRTGFTYSGHPTAAAAGLACLEVTEADDLLGRAGELHQLLGNGLSTIQAATGAVAEVRGEGAIWAIDLADDHSATATAVADRLLSEGVIVRPIGDRTVAMCPPLVITDTEIDRLLSALHEAVAR